MSVLNKFTKRERKTLNRCLKNKVNEFLISKYMPNQKIVTFCFCEPVSMNRVIKRIISSLTYFASIERIKNKTFKIFVCFSLKDRKVGDKFESFLPVLCEEDGIICSFVLLANLSRFLADKPFALHFIFKDGNFEDDEPKNINKGKIFIYDKCVACFVEEPKVHFVDCGHVCLCVDCDAKATLTKCPVCKTENNIKRLV